MLLPDCKEPRSDRRPRVPYAIPVDTGPAGWSVREVSEVGPTRRWNLVPIAAIMMTVVVVLAIGVSLGAMLRRDSGTEGETSPDRTTSLGDVHESATSPLTVREGALGADRPQEPEYSPANLSATRPASAPLLAATTDRVAAESDTNRAAGNSSNPAAVQPPSPSAPPLQPPVQRQTLVHAKALAGTPVGVGWMEVVFPDDQCPLWYPDIPLQVEEAHGGVRFPTCEVIRGEAGEANKYRVQRVVVRFVFCDAEAVTIRLGTPNESWMEPVTIPIETAAAGEYRELLDRWWQQQQEELAELSGSRRFVRQLTHRVLARRLGHAVPPFPARELDEQPMANLERHFERTLSTLLGIDSLLLAVPDVSGAGYDQRAQQSRLPLPPPMSLPSLTIPPSSRRVAVEEIAFQIPADCFYVRCNSVKNFAWMRAFMTGWGGSLNDIVSLPTLDSDIRKNLEQQLALGLERSQQLGIDEAISDMAFIGADFFFREGAAVGVVFEAVNEGRLQAILQKQRAEAVSRHAGVQQKTMTIRGYPVNSLVTDDNTIRSFYVTKGRFHLVTNSLQVAKQFLTIENGAGSVGKLNEYQFALAQHADQGSHRVLIYLSDPFFRRLASPHYRIELGRRARALAQLQELAVASLVATAVGTPAQTTEELIDREFLPTTFDKRPDGGRALLAANHVVDSLRGRRGTFLPIPDMSVVSVAEDEAAEYAQFVRRYQRQWGRVDPLTVALDARRDSSERLEDVQIGIWITPYARQRYAFLARHLAPSTRQLVAQLPGDVLRVDAALKDARGKRYQVHLGLQDDQIPYRFEEGELVRTNSTGRLPFSTTHQYVAISPSGTEGFRLVRQFVSDLQQGPTAHDAAAAPIRPSPLVGVLASMFGINLGKFLEALMFSGNAVVTRDNWTTYAYDPEISARVLPQLSLANDPDSAQIRLAVADPNQAAVADYLHAYAYVQSRRASAQTAQMVNDMTTQFGVLPEQGCSAAEQVFAARPVCALRGTFELTETPQGQFWTSSAWPEPSCYVLQVMPPGYQFPFLAWLHGASVQFVLSNTTLQANVMLRVDPGDTAPVQAAGLSQASKTTANDLLFDSPEGLSEAVSLSAGDQVVVAAQQAPLRLGETTRAEFPRHARLTVIEVRGDWIGVWGVHKNHAVRGWVHRKHLAKN